MTPGASSTWRITSTARGTSSTRGSSIPQRTAIRGWSASGYTTLAALTFADQFQAGVSHFGISDLETMTTDTHKFESRYLDRLVGPYPDRRDVYLERSPIHHLEQITVPLALFQGSEDTVVPPDQAEKMYDAMAAARPARRAWSSSKAKATASAAPRTSAAPSKANSTSTARSSASRRRGSRSAWRSRTCRGSNPSPRLLSLGIAQGEGLAAA